MISRRAGSPRNSGAEPRDGWTAERGSGPRQAPSTCVLAVCSGFTHQQSRQIPYNSSQTGARAHEVHQQPVCGLSRSGTVSCRLSAELWIGPGPFREKAKCTGWGNLPKITHMFILGKHALGRRGRESPECEWAGEMQGCHPHPSWRAPWAWSASRAPRRSQGGCPGARWGLPRVPRCA